MAENGGIVNHAGTFPDWVELYNPGGTPIDLASGADFVNSARGFMFALGCIQAMQCHKNTCPTGITTHNLKLQKGLDPTDKANRVAFYHQNLTYGVGMIAHACGVSEPRKLGLDHVHIVTSHGMSIPLSEFYPQPIVILDEDHNNQHPRTNSLAATEVNND
jgi:hypothetical protein